MTQTTTPTPQTAPAQSGQSARSTYIDTARGIGIVLLVLGHIVSGGSYLFNWIFSFHMPLFFLLSGLCVKEEKINNIKFLPYVKIRARKRLLPYFIVVAIGVVICMIIPSCREVVIADGLALQLQHIFLRMAPRDLYVGQAWFLASLFWTEIYFYLWYHFCGKKHWLWQTAVMLLLLLIAYNLWHIQPVFPITNRIYFQMDTACAGAFCYILGFQIRRYQLLEKIKKWGWLLIVPLLLCNIYFGTWKNGYVNLCDLVFGNRYYYLIAMCCGMAAILLIAFYLPKLPLMAWYGRNSLPLYAGHTFLIYLVREWVYLATGTYYTMMSDTMPYQLAFIMAIIVLLLFLPFGKLYALLYQQILNAFQHSKIKRSNTP